jgi:BolA family transcriptional regulator, general stress-responsive regulator
MVFTFSTRTQEFSFSEPGWKGHRQKINGKKEEIMSVADEIRSRLQTTFTPRELEVVDDSASHAGHAGNTMSGESHFNVRIVADAFAPMNRLARHRAVHAALGKELVGRIHALALDISG